jgi:hypothetical protein
LATRENAKSSQRTLVFFIAAFSIFLFSFPIILKFIGYWGLFAFAGIFLLFCYSKDLLQTKVGNYKRVLALVLIAVSVIYLTLHPLAVKRLAIGQGSDRGDALIRATSAMLKGNNPYGSVTVLGNPITPLPGALALAVPFVAFGIPLGFQTIFWLFVFLILLYLKWGVTVRNGVILALCLSPAVFQDLVTDGDFFANSFYVFSVLVLWLYFGHKGLRWFWPLMLGIAITSRPCFWIVPLLFYPAAVEVQGAKVARVGVIISFAVSFSLTAFFALAYFSSDLSLFPPFHLAGKLLLSPIQALALSLLVGPLLLYATNKYLFHADRFMDGSIKFVVILCLLVIAGYLANSLHKGTFSGIIYLSQAAIVWPFSAYIFSQSRWPTSYWRAAGL